MSKNFFRASAADFKKIPGSPVAYWLSEKLIGAFVSCPKLFSVAPTKQGLATGDNDRFLRRWFEVSLQKTNMGVDVFDYLFNKKKWFSCNKGGEYRKWYGNRDFIVNWEDSGKEIKSFKDDKGKLRSRPQNESYYFKKGLTWSAISSGNFAMRYSPAGVMFETKGAMCFPSEKYFLEALGFLNCKVVRSLLLAMAPTLDFHEGPIGRLPFKNPVCDMSFIKDCIDISLRDWDSYETSWDFEVNPLVDLSLSTAHCPLTTHYDALRRKWLEDVAEMRRLETENNRIFIEAYGLQDELTPEVPWHEITLTCNPWYRYGKKALANEEFPIDAELEERLKADTVKELISYAVGCMMGRYSLDKPGLVLADQGATEADYYAKIGKEKPAAKFAVDADGIIPILDNDWFEDDIVSRFKKFIKVAFGEEHFFENIAWIEEALGKDIRTYFTRDFYKDHLQRYQNRPIYWMFQSPKGAFRALIYMHRYKPDIVGGVLGYLRSLQTKIDNQLNVSLQIASDSSKSNSERLRANKDASRYAKFKNEIDCYEREVLYPLSTERIEIDLDDGVKVNYMKFKGALTKVASLESKGE